MPRRGERRVCHIQLAYHVLPTKPAGFFAAEPTGLMVPVQPFHAACFALRIDFGKPRNFGKPPTAEPLGFSTFVILINVHNCRHASSRAGLAEQLLRKCRSPAHKLTSGPFGIPRTCLGTKNACWPSSCMEPVCCLVNSLLQRHDIFHVPGELVGLCLSGIASAMTQRKMGSAAPESSTLMLP